jgi:hypothetical protein
MEEKEEVRRVLYKKLIIISLIIVVVVAAVFLTWFLYPLTEDCHNRECFSEALVFCERAQWINDDNEATWLYTIKGQDEERCEVEVELLQAKQGGQELRNIEGKSMICILPLKTMTIPEQNLESCHGLLKEELQDLIIKKMHSYILENLGEISKNLTDINSI